MSPPPDTPIHGDPGLQPERTDMAWGRTTLSLTVAAAIFLRWMPDHGWFTATLVAAAIVTALAINLTRKRRFHRAINGIKGEAITADVASTAAVAASVIILAALGICTVLLIPLEQ
ncbi:DUF202 domain-containing protein [Arthrobacter globiformis]|uniref:DUF202 domain-containing protein n=1 Tax=Arthrobacter globiformis TaxID=1665 RepID=UPI002781EA30|nr:DUF202 domain-containing protein [Arthrobacter globiformis]MDQ0864510.1 uncharacterized membrane protein YidH (DUF202 family) [Arthrobacter globiformis]